MENGINLFQEHSTEPSVNIALKPNNCIVDNMPSPEFVNVENMLPVEEQSIIKKLQQNTPKNNVLQGSTPDYDDVYCSDNPSVSMNN
jgi:hypothetical protein